MIRINLLKPKLYLPARCCAMFDKFRGETDDISMGFTHYSSTSSGYTLEVDAFGTHYTEYFVYCPFCGANLRGRQK